MMNPSEMLRKLADIIDSMGMDSAQTNMQPQASMEPVTGLKSVEVDHTDQSNDATMIPPLQQKIELLKKATGVENAFDKNTDGNEGPEHEEAEQAECSGEDEMSILKKNAGLPTAAREAASEDNDVTE